MGNLDAIDSIGMSVSAEPDGIAFDLTTIFDTEQLTEDERAALAAPARENTAMSFVPADAFGVLGAVGTDTSLLASLDMIEQQTPDAAAAIDQAGVREFVEAMNGDIALEVGPGTDGPVSGALLIGTDDPERTKSFLDVVAGYAIAGLAQPGVASPLPEDGVQAIEACQGSAACEQEVIDALGSTAMPSQLPKSEEYEGTTIFYLDDPALRAAGFVPAYAVVDGVGVIATSPEEIHQLIDTKSSGEDVRSTSLYTAATASVPTAESVFFLDVHAVASAVRAELPAEAQAFYDEEVGPNLEPLTAFVVGGESDERHQGVRMFLHIGGGG
jgi:hypothetical protein